MNINGLVNEFNELFKTRKYNIYFAPGRVNLIGGHVDYHGGFVLPCAINYGTYLVISERSDELIKGYSKNFTEEGIKSSDLNNLEYRKKDNWFNYSKGIIKSLKERGYKINNGFNMFFYGNIPNGAGLSSSASLELVILEALDSLLDLKIPNKEKVLIAVNVENDYIGVNCGIMDQYAVAFGKKDSAILLNCDTITHEYVDLDLKTNKILIINTNKKRKLSDSKYNERRNESQLALDILLKETGKEKINQLDIVDFDKFSSKLENDIERKRAKHIIKENIRTKNSFKALKENDIKALGEYITKSHYSLKDDYEVSCDELDYLVEILNAQNGVLGSRMTGAGFGGCTVSIVDENKINEISNEVEKMYYEKFGFKPSIYKVDVGNGCKEIKLGN